MEEDMHSAVAIWLTDNGYAWQHEVNAPQSGRVDFIGVHADGTILVVEVKPNAYSFSDTVSQVLNYQQQFGSTATPAIAIPRRSATDGVVKTCEDLAIRLIEIDISGTVRISVDIPDDWTKELRVAAFEAGAQSVADYVRGLIAGVLGKAPVKKTWGGKRKVLSIGEQ